MSIEVAARLGVCRSVTSAGLHYLDVFKAAGHVRRSHAARVIEGCFFMCIAWPVVCALHPRWSVHHAHLIALRDRSPHIIRPAMNPTEVGNLSKLAREGL